MNTHAMPRLSRKISTMKNDITTRIRFLLALMAMMMTLLLAPGTAGAQAVTILHSFNDSLNNSDDLNNPEAPLIADHAGNLYGTTISGGTGVYYGGVFELSPPAVKGTPWTETILYNFSGGVDGAAPYGGLVMDANGALYGTTSAGGAGKYGVVYQLSPPAVQGDAWTETVLFSFDNGNDGGGPVSALVFDKSGNLYGTADSGGSGGGGVIFELSPPAISGDPWTENVLYSFVAGKKSVTGCQPESSLLPAQSGAFYGTAVGCGANGGGVAYEIAPPAISGGAWAYTVIHVFGFPNGTGDGNFPQANLIAGKGGVLYGATQMGGTAALGTVYSLTPPKTKGGAWTESVLHSFANTTDGYGAIGGLTLTANGTLYGTTCCGGSNNVGNIFKVTPPAVSGGSWTLTTLYNCSNAATSPAFPYASLLLINGVLYSTSHSGGTNNEGTVFKFIP
jgi:uncharacterized repeat protein (TIGR03803 family)